MSTSSIQTRSDHYRLSTIATALRAAADRVEAFAHLGGLEITETSMTISLQVHTKAVCYGNLDVADELRAKSVDALLDAFGVDGGGEYFSNGHYGTQYSVRRRDGYDLNVFGSMAPPPAVLDALIDEAYAEEAQRLDDRKARLDQIDEWMLRHAGHGHPIRDPRGEYRVGCDWTLAIDAHEAIGGKLPQRVPGAMLVDDPAQPCICANSDSTWVMCPVHGYQKIDRTGLAPAECDNEPTEEIVIGTATEAQATSA